MDDRETRITWQTTESGSEDSDKQKQKRYEGVLRALIHAAENNDKNPNHKNPIGLLEGMQSLESDPNKLAAISNLIKEYKFLPKTK